MTSEAKKELLDAYYHFDSTFIPGRNVPQYETPFAFQGLTVSILQSDVELTDELKRELKSMALMLEEFKNLERQMRECRARLHHAVHVVRPDRE